MKVAIHYDFGGFDLPIEMFEQLWNSKHINYEVPGDHRADPELIKVLEVLSKEELEDLKIAIVDIPDESTDFLITDYDGVESLWYVLDGRIRRQFIECSEYDDEELW